MSPEDHPVSQYEFDVLIGADGKRNTLEGEFSDVQDVRFSFQNVFHCPLTLDVLKFRRL